MNEQMNFPVLQLRNVSKRIGSKTIIDGLSFEVPRGEVFGFLGPNGAGKTTTIRMIVGLMKITEGEILINGVSVQKEFERAIRHVGAIVENPEMYKFLTGYQNLIHYARMVPGTSRQRIDEVIKLVGLNSRIHDKVKTYSLGMRQRLGVAQALLHNPSLLILDEPTNGLDPAGIRELRDYLRKLTREEGITVLVSSHLLSEMELMCDRVAIIQAGKLVGVQTLQEMVTGGDTKAHQSVLFDVDNRELARSVLSGLHNGEAEAAITNDGVTALLERENIPAAVAKLVEADVKIYGIRARSRTLEDQFLEMTGRESVVV